MPGEREYPVAPLVHRPDCPEISMAFRGQVQLSVEVAFQWPNGFMHHCMDHLANQNCVVETRYYPPHHHRPSTHWPDDAPVPLCHVCGGTHAGEQRSGITVASPRLHVVTSPAVQVVTPSVILPGDARPGEP